MALVDTGTVESDELRISNATPGDFYRLMKPRVMYLVIFTAFVGMVLAPTHINPLLAAISLLCIAVGAGASGALNMWYEADIDAQMTRTAGRPIPTGAVTRDEALVFALVLVVISVMTLGLVSNWMAAAFLGFTIFFYAVPYTMYLKMATPQNIVIGGAAGAFPPMVAWTAMTGTISLESAVLFAIIFLWTPPHFWALALFKLKDYETVGMPMMPNVAGEKSTRRQMFVYSIILAVSGILPTVLGFAGLIYGAVAVLLGARFVQLSWVVLRNNGRDNMQAERKLFVFSIYYLFILFAALLIEPAINLARGLLGV